MRDQIDQMIGVSLDAEIETPPAVGAGLPEIACLVVLLGLERRMAEVLEENGVNIENIYGTTNGGEHAHLVLAVNRPEKAEKLLAKFAEGLVLANR